MQAACLDPSPGPGGDMGCHGSPHLDSPHLKRTNVLINKKYSSESKGHRHLRVSLSQLDAKARENYQFCHSKVSRPLLKIS